MKWRKKEMRTMGDMLTAVYDILRNGIREDAQEFMRLYETEEPNVARTNIGFLGGDMNKEEALRLYDWFECEHPYFGKEHPSAEKAFELGQRMALGEFDVSE